MPIHAAGIYDGPSESHICISDFFVSSYTPSLGALIDAQKTSSYSSPTSEVKILAVAQPSAGGSCLPIPNVVNELKKVVDIVPPQNLLSLGNSSEPDYDGTRATLQNVLLKLPEANVLHLACHATQDSANPLKSGFILAHGERLTIDELVKHRLPNAHTAILNACHTASNNAYRPDESLNLSSAMLLVGFRSVLSTKW